MYGQFLNNFRLTLRKLLLYHSFVILMNFGKVPNYAKVHQNERNTT